MATRSSGNRDVFFSRSTDGGVTWLASDIQINTVSFEVFSPHVCCDGP